MCANSWLKFNIISDLLNEELNKERKELYDPILWKNTYNNTNLCIILKIIKVIFVKNKIIII